MFRKGVCFFSKEHGGKSGRKGTLGSGTVRDHILKKRYKNDEGLTVYLRSYIVHRKTHTEDVKL